MPPLETALIILEALIIAAENDSAIRIQACELEAVKKLIEKEIHEKALRG